MLGAAGSNLATCHSDSVTGAGDHLVTGKQGAVQDVIRLQPLCTPQGPANRLATMATTWTAVAPAPVSKTQLHRAASPTGCTVSHGDSNIYSEGPVPEALLLGRPICCTSKLSPLDLNHQVPRVLHETAVPNSCHRMLLLPLCSVGGSCCYWPTVRPSPRHQATSNDYQPESQPSSTPLQCATLCTRMCAIPPMSTLKTPPLQSRLCNALPRLAAAPDACHHIHNCCLLPCCCCYCFLNCYLPCSCRSSSARSKYTWNRAMI